MDTYLRMTSTSSRCSWAGSRGWRCCGWRRSCARMSCSRSPWRRWRSFLLAEEEVQGIPSSGLLHLLPKMRLKKPFFLGLDEAHRQLRPGSGYHVRRPGHVAPCIWMAGVPWLEACRRSRSGMTPIRGCAGSRGCLPASIWPPSTRFRVVAGDQQGALDRSAPSMARLVLLDSMPRMRSLSRTEETSGLGRSALHRQSAGPSARRFRCRPASRRRCSRSPGPQLDPGCARRPSCFSASFVARLEPGGEDDPAGCRVLVLDEGLRPAWLLR